MNFEAASTKLAHETLELRGRYRRTEREINKCINTIQAEKSRLEDSISSMKGMFSNIYDAYALAYPYGKEVGTDLDLYKLMGVLNKVDGELRRLMTTQRGM